MDRQQPIDQQPVCRRALFRQCAPRGVARPPERLGRTSLSPVAASVAVARRWVAALLAEHGVRRSADDCVLMVSEVVTNAVTYGKGDGDWLIQVEVWRAGAALWIDVHNSGIPDDVRVRSPAADEVHGRGLALVAALADSWEVGPSRFGGTRVAFCLARVWGA